MKHFNYLIAPMLIAVSTVHAGCYTGVMKTDAPAPNVLNILLIDETTPVFKSVQEGYEQVVDKIARHYGNRVVVVPFSSLTSKNPPIAMLDVNNEPPISDTEMQKTPIKIGKVMQKCVLKSTQKNAIAIKKLVHDNLQLRSSFDAYSEIPFALKTMLSSYIPSSKNSRVRLIVYSDGYINTMKGFSLYTNGKPRVPNPDKDLKSFEKIEPISMVEKPFEVIWFGLGAVPETINNGYLAPSDLEKLKLFWTGILQKMGASKIQLGLIVNNPIID